MVLLYANYLQPHRFKSVALIGAQIYIGSGTRKWIREERADSANQKYVNYYNDLHGTDKAKLLMRQFWNYQFAHEDPAITPDMLQTMTANFLVVQGDNDFIGLFNALEMHQYIAHSHLWIYPNGGHLPHLNKNNSEDFAKRTLEFFSGAWNVAK
jgi:pimeloyl-ACP methyl ester carboxylesterase